MRSMAQPKAILIDKRVWQSLPDKVIIFWGQQDHWQVATECSAFAEPGVPVSQAEVLVAEGFLALVSETGTAALSWNGSDF